MSLITAYSLPGGNFVGRCGDLEAVRGLLVPLGGDGAMMRRVYACISGMDGRRSRRRGRRHADATFAVMSKLVQLSVSSAKTFLADNTDHNTSFPTAFHVQHVLEHD